jgi:hypothetical protein
MPSRTSWSAACWASSSPAAAFSRARAPRARRCTRRAAPRPPRLRTRIELSSSERHCGLRCFLGRRLCNHCSRLLSATPARPAKQHTPPCAWTATLASGAPCCSRASPRRRRTGAGGGLEGARLQAPAAQRRRACVGRLALQRQRIQLLGAPPSMGAGRQWQRTTHHARKRHAAWTGHFLADAFREDTRATRDDEQRRRAHKRTDASRPVKARLMTCVRHATATSAGSLRPPCAPPGPWARCSASCWARCARRWRRAASAARLQACALPWFWVACLRRAPHRRAGAPRCACRLAAPRTAPL